MEREASKPHIRLDDFSIDWGRIEAWCKASSGFAICGPVLERVEKAGRLLEAERDDLVEQLEASQKALSRALAIMVDEGYEADPDFGPAYREMAAALTSNPAISPDNGWHESAAHTPVLQPLGACGLVSADGRYACIKDLGHEGPHGSNQDTSPE